MRTMSAKARRVALLASMLAAPITAPALAQDHSMMHMSAPVPAKQPVDAGKAARSQKTDSTTTQAHHAHPSSAPPPAEMPAPVPAPAASVHDMHDMAGMEEGMSDADMPHAAGRPLTPVPALTDADRAAAMPAQGGHPAHDNAIHTYTLVDRLETWNADGGSAIEWETRTWIGTDLDRLWLRSEGERVGGHTEGASLEALYGRSVATWWDVVAGLRHDFTPGGSQDFAAVGIAGTAPLKLNIEATAYVGQGGQTAARVQAEYQTLLSNRLILQPLVEMNLYGKDDPRRGIGAGLSTFETGLRLRYEITRRFAPYIGVVHEQALGNTAGLRRQAGRAASDTRLVAGLRFWF